MTQKLFLRIAALVLCALSLSCRSMLDYTDSSPGKTVNVPEAVVSGHFVSKEKRREGDILISGYIAQSAWSSFIPFAGLRYKWEGTLSFSDGEQSLAVVNGSQIPIRQAVH